MDVIVKPETMNEKADIRFEFVGFEENWDESNSYPMGILFISACLKRCGFTNIEYTDHVCLLRKLEDPNNYQSQWMAEARNKNRKDLFDHLKERKPHIIFLGPVTSFHLVELTDLVPRLREQHPEELIIAGGPHFGKDTGLDTELLEKYPELDGIIVGEAEETTMGVAERFYSEYCRKDTVPSRADFQNRLAEVPGIVVRGKSLASRNPPSLNDLPFPDMELLEKHLGDRSNYVYPPRYRLSNRRNPKTWVSRAVVDSDDDGGSMEDDVRYFDYQFASRDCRFPFGVIIGSRGCPYNCSFCCSQGPRRVHSTNYVFNQIMDLNMRYGIRLFVFFDPLFTTSSQYDRKRVEELCKMICDSGIDIRYMIDIRADVILDLPEELLGLMIQTGCIEFNLGLEKGSDRMLKKMTKDLTTSDHRDAVAKLRRIGENLGRKVIVNGTFVLGGPEEAKDDVRETLIQCFSLHLDQATLYPLEICPGTRISEEAIKSGILKNDLAPYLNVKEYPLYATSNLPRSYLLNIKKRSEKVLDEMEELKKAMQELERQFLTEDMRDGFSCFEIEKTKCLHETIRVCIDDMLDYLRKHPDEGLLENGKLAPEVDFAVRNVDKDIAVLEEKLARKYPDYDYHYGDYYLGTLMSNWKHFLTIFMELFSKNNF